MHNVHSLTLLHYHTNLFFLSSIPGLATSAYFLPPAGEVEEEKNLEEREEKGEDELAARSPHGSSCQAEPETHAHSDKQSEEERVQQTRAQHNEPDQVKEGVEVPANKKEVDMLRAVVEVESEQIMGTIVYDNKSEGRDVAFTQELRMKCTSSANIDTLPLSRELTCLVVQEEDTNEKGALDDNVILPKPGMERAIHHVTLEHKEHAVPQRPGLKPVSYMEPL